LLPVTESWGSELTALIPLALVIAVSPLTIIPAVLVLQAPRPRPSSLAFLAGWLFGLAALTVLGSALIVFGIYRWVTRRRQSESPAWMRSFATISPRRAAITGLVLTVVRVDALIMCLFAGLDIGTGHLSVAGKLVCAVFFVAVAASTVAIPILAYAVAGSRLDNALGRLKDWMEKNNAALLAAILVLIGAMLVHKGIHALHA
jgi:hypothetical protein